MRGATRRTSSRRERRVSRDGLQVIHDERARGTHRAWALALALGWLPTYKIERPLGAGGMGGVWLTTEVRVGPQPCHAKGWLTCHGTRRAFRRQL
jgi:hypothetical protein